MKYFLLIATVFLLACNSNQKNVKQKEIENIHNNGSIDYPQQVNDLGVKGLYDSAKWYIYTWYCDVLYMPKSDSTVNKPFGELELRFDNLVLKHDTLVLNFNFMDMEQPILSSMMRQHRELMTGVGFDTTTKKKIYMLSSNANVTYKNNPYNRYENPLQPEVIAFIKNNKNKLNPWFKEEARRRKLID